MYGYLVRLLRNAATLIGGYLFQSAILTKTPYDLLITPCQGLAGRFKSLLLLELVPEYIFDMTNVGATNEVLIDLEPESSPSSAAAVPWRKVHLLVLIHR